MASHPTIQPNIIGSEVVRHEVTKSRPRGYLTQGLGSVLDGPCSHKGRRLDRLHEAFVRPLLRALPRQFTQRLDDGVKIWRKGFSRHAG